MKRLLLPFVSAVLILSVVAGIDRVGAASPAGLSVGHLRTEYASNPLGIDVERPRLSWVLESSERAELQSAYRILVASSPGRLAVGGADVWDSGVVDSGQSVNVTYGGPALESSTRYFWAVRVWDDEGDASGWSQSAWWETAVLKASDWQADWIGAPPPPPQEDPPTLDGAHWIWYPEGNPATEAPVATRYFRRVVNVPADRQLDGAEMVVSADDQYVLYVNGTEVGRSSGQPDAWRTAAVIDLDDVLTSGDNTFAVTATNTFGPGSWIGKLRLHFADGTTSEVVTDTSWVAANTEQPGWQQPGFDDSAWVDALDVAAYGGGPWGPQVHVDAGPPPPPAPLLRTDFDVADKAIRSARVYVSGLGYYELSLNGKRVGDRVLAPDRNDYTKRVPYATYDVTDQLRSGANAIGAALGRGYYALRQANVWAWQQAPWIDEPKLRLQLDVQYADGSTDQIVSGPDWRVTEGPTVSDSVYGGETYDARREMPGWSRRGYDASAWTPAAVVDAPAGRMVAETTDPIRVTDTIQPVAVTRPREGIQVFDMGRVVSGWARLTVAGQPGTTVTLRYGEKLNADGTVNIDNGLVSGRHQTDEYILRGDGAETWEPKFSYKGFRYVQVDGLTRRPLVEGRVVHSAVPSVGEFSADNPMYEEFHGAMRRTILNNLHGIPTDTPMREKNGWTGDAQLAAPSMTYNFDMSRFFTEWLDDIRDSQLASGQIPQIVPSPGWGYGAAPEWTAVYPIVLWEMYKTYGDTGILADHYDSLAAYVDWEIGRLDDGISSTGLGDWVSPPCVGIPPEDTRLSATAYVYRELTLTASIADVVGRSSDAARYRDIAGHVRDRLNDVFLDQQAGYYVTAKDPEYRQTNNLLPLAFGMVPDPYVDSVVQSLVDDIEARDIHLNTGALGTSVLLPMLSQHGHHALANAIANQTTFPSWGYWFENGADTMWECWDLAASSRDHYFLGTIDEWFYQDVAGINANAPGYRESLIQPRIGGGLNEATGTVQTVYGELEVAWETTDDTVTLEVTIPANTTAEIHVPTSAADSVTESGAPAAQAKGVQFLRVENGTTVYQVGSGKYLFVAAL